jgi:hypothetical protein
MIAKINLIFSVKPESKKICHKDTKAQRTQTCLTAGKNFAFYFFAEKILPVFVPLW